MICRKKHSCDVLQAIHSWDKISPASCLYQMARVRLVALAYVEEWWGDATAYETALRDYETAIRDVLSVMGKLPAPREGKSRVQEHLAHLDGWHAHLKELRAKLAKLAKLLPPDGWSSAYERSIGMSSYERQAREDSLRKSLEEATRNHWKELSQTHLQMFLTGKIFDKCMIFWSR